MFKLMLFIFLVLKKPKDFGLDYFQSIDGVLPYNGLTPMKVFLTQMSEIPSLGLGAPMHFYKHPL